MKEPLRLEIETVLAVHDLESGRVLSQPIARPRHAAYDTATDAQITMELFLTELLERDGASTRAAFSLPADDIDVCYVEVELPNARALVGGPLSFSMPCVVLPHRRARWVLVLPLSMTVYVGRRESLERVVASEARRLLAALEPDAFTRLGFFCARATRLERMTVSVRRRPAPEHGTKTLRRRLDRTHLHRRALKTLRAVGRQVRARDVREPEPVGMRDALTTLSALLRAHDKPQPRRSVVVVAPQGCGKTTLIRAWLRAHTDRWLFATSVAQLVAGMSSVGQWQERIRRVMEAAETLDATLWLDDLRDLMGGRSGAFDLAGAIRPWLDEGRVRLVSELTPEAADLFASRHAGLFAAMHPLRLESHGPREAAQALRRCIDHAKRFEPDRPALAEEAIPTVIELTDRFVPYRTFPAKAVQLYEELRAAAERRHSHGPRSLTSAYVYESFSRATGVPEFLLRDDRAWRSERATEHLRRRIVGQPEAVSAVVDALAVVKAGLSPGDRPLASFLFVGPTGVGKTALARALAELVFGSEQRLARFDMSELSGPDAAERLLRGVGGSEGRLTSIVRREPFSVVLLDEIEKAHPSVFDLLLGVLGEGRLTDARGRTAFFHNVILVMTSNLGTREGPRPVGIDPPEVSATSRFTAAVEAHFRPELVNRIDRIIAFSQLSREEVRGVAQRVARSIGSRRGFGEMGVTLEVTDRALDALTAGGYDAAFGARAMRRELEDGLVAPIARALGPLGASLRGAHVRCRAADEPGPSRTPLSQEIFGSIAVDVSAGAGEPREAQGALAEISRRRRWVQAQFELPTVEELQERHDYLLAELSYGPDRGSPTGQASDAPRGRAIGELQGELHGLKAKLDLLRGGAEELSSIEELVLSASLAAEGGDELREDARGAEMAFRAALLEVLLAERTRHQCIVVAREHDNRRPLSRWIGQLIDALPRLGWRLVGHVHRGTEDRPTRWPRARAFGPELSASELAAQVRARGRDRLSVVLRISGRHAGAILALEAGHHRHLEPEPNVAFTTFAVRMLTVDRSSLKDEELDGAMFSQGETIPSARKLIPAVRETTATTVRVGPNASSVDVPRDEYWAHIEAIALAHLLARERLDSAQPDLFVSPLDLTRDEEEGSDPT